MTNTKQYIAVDLGAESGRVMLGTVGAGKVSLDEMHRFTNGPTELGETLRWDFEGLLGEIKTGLAKAVASATGEVSGIGVDSWGVDFGLLDADGNLLEPPYHYRDARTDTMLDEAFKRMPKREIYGHTGIQFMQLNSVFQLLAMVTGNDPALAKTDKITFMADLVGHALSGELYAEYSLASTSQLMDMRTGAWSTPLLDALGIPQRILPKVVPSCTVVGTLRDAIAKEIGAGAIPVIATASHDTGAAVAAVPAQDENWAYLSSGTWSLMGVELDEPVISDATFEHDFTNEGGVDNTIRLLKNIIGLWLLQESRRQWQREGEGLSYDELTALARGARPFAARITPDDPDFLAPGDMPARINAQLEATGQAPLINRGEMVRSILEALAFVYRTTLENLESITGRVIEVVHIVGGGTQNELLNQFAANAMNRRVATGPIEATSIGNVLLQARAVGQIESLDALRAVVRASCPLKEYTPRNVDTWDAEYCARK